MAKLLPGSFSLRHRLTLLALGASCLVAAIGAAAIWSNREVADGMRRVQEERLQPLVELDKVGRELERQRAAVLLTLAATNDLMQQKLDERVARDRKEIPAILDRLLRKEGDAAAKTLVSKLATAVQQAEGEALDRVLDRLHNGQFAEADIASQRFYQPRMDAASAALDELIAAHVRLAREDYDRALGTVRRQAMISILETVAALLGGLGLALLIGNALHRVLGAPEKALSDWTRELAQGRLAHRIETAERDRTSIAALLNAMSRDFSALVTGVRSGAEQVAGVAERLAGSSRDLSDRATAQAANLEQTAASLEELASTIAQNADRAEHARGLSETASAVAAKGGEAMAGVNETMRALVESENRVAEIVSTIDAIAFQTNLLALNAAVEAARAGEEGRGFAVVASEVRSLSQRSAQAAREIRDLVRDSVARARDGRAQVAQAASEIQALIEGARGVAEAMAGIAGATREQSAGVQQLNATVDRLDQAVQATARIAETTSREAQAMRERAAAMVQAVGRFEAERPAEAPAHEAAVGPALPGPPPALAVVVR